MSEYPRLETLPLSALRKNADNPNEMRTVDFDALVETVDEQGWLQPMATVVLVEGDEQADGVYEIVAGHHRFDAARALGHEGGPCWVLDPNGWDQDQRDMALIKMNQLHGKLNPAKFAEVYQRLTHRYEGEVVKRLMGFTTEDAFAAVYKEARAALPPEMQKALDSAKGEIKTIDDLSSVLNRLFSEFGETLPSNFMVFSWGGREVMWVRADGPLWHLAARLAALVKANGLDMSEELRLAVDAHLAIRQIDYPLPADGEGGTSP